MTVLAMDHRFDNRAIRLRDEGWCVSYLFRLRWPDGFVCPACGFKHKLIIPVKTPVCRFCGRQGSLTAGTLLHGSKKKVSDWLQLIWRLSKGTEQLSAKKIQQHLGLHSYQTAWTWMVKLRLAMQGVLETRCRHTVKIDLSEQSTEAALETVADNAISATDHPIVAAVESVAEGRALGRVRMRYLDQIDTAHVAEFIQQYVRPGSTIIAPDRFFFDTLKCRDHLYTVASGQPYHESIQNLIGAYLSWYKDRKFRSTNQRYRQGCLDEFCFYLEAQLSIDQSQVFDRLLMAMLQHGPATSDLPTATSEGQWGEQ